MTNGFWQIQCSDRNEINAIIWHARDMSGTCTGHAWDMNVRCMGCAWAVHRPCTGHSQGVHWSCKELKDWYWRDFCDQVCSGCHILVTSFVLGGEFWWQDLFRATRFDDKDSSGWHVLLTTSTRNLIKIEMFWVKNLFQNYHYYSMYYWVSS